MENVSNLVGLLSQWESNNGIEELTDFANAKISEIDSNDDATLYEISGESDGCDYETSIIIYHNSNDLFCLSDWQIGYPHSLSEVADYDNWRHISGARAIVFCGLPRLLL